MSTFNKIYKKVANNGNDADYQVVGQVGVNGVPLDIMKGASSSSDGEIGLVPKPCNGDQNKILSGSGTFKSPTLSTYSAMNGRIRVGLKLDDEVISLTDLPPVSTSQPGFMTVIDKTNLDNLMYWLHLPIGWYRDSEKSSSTELAPNNGQSYTFTTSMYFNLNNPFVQEVYNDPSNHLVIMPMTNGSYHGGAHYIDIDRVELHKTTDNFRVDIQFSGYLSNCSSFTDKAGFTAMFACYFKGKYVVSANDAEDRFYVIK